MRCRRIFDKIVNFINNTTAQQQQQQKMHNPDLLSTNATAIGLPITELQITFSVQQGAQLPVQRKLKDLIGLKEAAKEFYYGIELAAHSLGTQPTLLDYNSFGPLLPLFTSLIWLGQKYWSVPSVNDVDAVRVAHVLHPQTIVLPHFSCYRADRQRLTEFLALNFTNILAVRGDQVEPDQEYKHASDMIRDIREVRGDTISIGAAGYPDMHPDSKSPEDDMEYLIKKVDAGADFIITQICFSATSLKKFIQDCRANGIQVPIIIGVFIPENMKILGRMMEIAKVRMPEEAFAKYKELSSNNTEFREYAVRSAVQMITEVLDAKLDIHGVQFFTMNKFKCTQRVLAEVIEWHKKRENKE